MMSGRLLLLTEGDKFKALRLRRGLRERECARRIGISRGTLRAMESSSHVSLRPVMLAARFFGVPPTTLAREVGGLAEMSGVT
jgi:transcriptional regulator with XRE-family HTH domain